MPDPVFAAPSTSLPCKAKPMVCLCISVTMRYWASCSPSIWGVRREREKKYIYLYFSLPRAVFFHLDNTIHGNTHLKLSLRQKIIYMQINNTLISNVITFQIKIYLYSPFRVFFDNGKSENLWISSAFIWNKLSLISAKIKRNREIK